MIAFLSGRVAAKGAGYAIVDVGGVGFRLLMSTPSLVALPAVGDDVTVHTFLNVREDELTLFGFESEDERETFERLISVGGVGPKLALAVLSSLKPDVLRTAVARDDVELLSTVPGVGKKTAQRVIIELKDKLGVPELGTGASAASVAGAEARDALLAMGFSSAEVTAALRDAPDTATAEQMLRLALKALGAGR
jgi:Holliday junction DNA helicase RuvA